MIQQGIELLKTAVDARNYSGFTFTSYGCGMYFSP